MVEEEAAAVPEIDAAMANDLLDVVIKTVGLPDLAAIREVAILHLHQINTDLERTLRPPPEPVEEPKEEAA